MNLTVESKELSGVPLYAYLFGGIFSTIEECETGATGVSGALSAGSPMFVRATKMMETYLKKGLSQNVLEDDLVDWINSEVLDNLKQNATLESMCEKGYVRLVKWVLEKYQHPKIGYTKGFCSACENGHLEIAKIMCETFPKVEKKCDLAFFVSCYGRNLDLMKWLVEKFPQITPEKKSFDRLCESGNLEAIKWFVERYPDFCEQTQDIAFRSACHKGHLDCAKWLLEKYPKNKDRTWVFQETCYKGHLDLAKWLVEQGITTRLDVYIYETAVSDGNWEMARFLTDNNFVSRNRAFNVLCWWRKLDMAKELLERHPKIDIHNNDDKALRQVLLIGYTDVAKWLMEKYMEDY